MSPLAITKAEKEIFESPIEKPHKEGEHVVVYLNEMKVELRDGEEIIASYPIISKGKPGSYYETIGGEYENDYKVALHFSSIGEVYMPYSVHVFGQYFIHGIPYYPSGERVSSAYSGGCVRLSDADAKKVYEFINRGTPIIITQGSLESFKASNKSPSNLMSQNVTNLMVATISLEALTQDNEILNTDRITITTRKDLLPRLLLKADSSVALLYANSVGQSTFIDLMNKKAKALGLTNTHFDNVTSPASTTYEDYDKFMLYINTYKSYLRKLETSTSPYL